jgi:hypothetical protein
MKLMQVHDAAELLRMEYCEAPMLQLTVTQAQRLCSLSEDLCDRALGQLVRSGFLVRALDGRYQRSDRADVEVIASLLRAM